MTRRFSKLPLWLIKFIGLIVPRRLRADWRREWEAELRYRETSLAEWDKLDWRNKLGLLWHSLGAFADALWLQPKRLEDEVFQDLRYGARMLLKNPGFTLIAALSLALGIGANTAIFSLLDVMLLRSLPVEEPDKLVLFGKGEETGPNTGFPNKSWDLFSYPFYQEVRRRNEVFSEVAAILSTPRSPYGVVNIKGASSEAEKLNLQLVSGSYFSALGV
ncbi:MAG: ABC transporter permease, partial [Blastocatellia bacterium]